MLERPPTGAPSPGKNPSDAHVRSDIRKQKQQQQENKNMSLKQNLPTV